MSRMTKQISLCTLLLKMKSSTNMKTMRKYMMNISMMTTMTELIIEFYSAISYKIYIFTYNFKDISI